jgi:hypothetical protein
MSVRPLRGALLLLVVPAILAGCDSTERLKIGPPPPCTTCGETPQNDTPQNTLIRLTAAYKWEVETEYFKLLSDDFRYDFSAEADSPLVALYGSSWGKLDEIQATLHLFHGFVAGTSEVVPGAGRIVLALNTVQYANDPEHADSAAWYRLATAQRVNMTVEVPGAADTLVYGIDDRHDFHLVRGDAAVLAADQPATSDRWYVRRWEDHSHPPASAPGPSEAFAESIRATTWGRLRAAYR